MRDRRRPDPARPWWRDAVVYQVYPRSFQDSDGDGLGDLRGVTSRLGHLERLGVDALWLSPFYPSPDADLGYDVADFTAVDPRLGSLADFDELVAEAHGRELRVVLDLVPSHTSIEHPWFRAHPERYIWSDGGPANNWLAAFGGPAWSRDERTGRWYLHSFYPEQPDLDWRNPEVRQAMGDVIRFWVRRGVDGFRVDAVDRLVKDARLRDDPPAETPFGLPLPEEYGGLDHVHSIDNPEIGIALEALRAAAGDALLIGEVYLPSARLSRYLEHLDLVFAFEFLHSPWDAGRLNEVIAAAVTLERVAWVLSNHDFPRLATRLGGGSARLAALLLLTLPGAAFVYQGDEIGLADGPGSDPPHDRAGRDAHRHPMQWTGQKGAGFSAGDPWLDPVDPSTRSVAAQERDPASLLNLYRRLIVLRSELLGAPIQQVGAAPGLVAFRRGAHAVVLNLAAEARPLPLAGTVALSVGEPSRGGASEGERVQVGARLGAGCGVVVRA